MPVHNIFPTPIYAMQLGGSTQGKINQELRSVYDPDKMVKNTHTHNHLGSHEVSCDAEGNMFSINIIKETPNFCRFVEQCVIDYAQELGMKAMIPFAITESWFTKHPKVNTHPFMPMVILTFLVYTIYRLMVTMVR